MTKVEDFRSWIRSIDRGPYYLGTRRLEKIPSGKVLIDRRAFELEEVEQIAEIFLSMKPVSKTNDGTGIWEKNGTLMKAVLLGVVALLVIVILIVRR
ncbi:MAG: hypothetical protein PXY39_01825 [archaeon]|nr:hypothetical protein [archaeon]